MKIYFGDYIWGWGIIVEGSDVYDENWITRKSWIGNAGMSFLSKRKSGFVVLMKERI